MSKKLKILLSAYACEPNKGSEPGVGWNWVKQIAKFHDVWVITRENNRYAIEKELEKNPLPGVYWIYYDLPFWLRFWKKDGRGVHLYYYLWQICIYFLARRLNRELNFNIAHHITFGMHWMTSFLYLLSIPFIWGPLGGAESSPIFFYKSFSLYGKIYEILRSLARKMGEKDPFLITCAKRVSIALAKTQETANKLHNIGCEKVIIYSESGINDEEILTLNSLNIRFEKTVRFISTGRLLHWKGVHLSIKAFIKFNRLYPDSEYWIIGDGPERNYLNILTKELQIKGKVLFLGWIKREDVLKKLSDCDIFIHPTLHDSGGWVCLEAMAAGRPVICLDLGGPATQVTEETGFKIPALNPDQAINDMAEAMLKLARDPELRLNMGEAGRRRVKEYFSWDKKGEWINNIYQELFNSEL